jgi:hypothetical protein
LGERAPPTAEETAKVILRIKNLSQDQVQRELQLLIGKWNFQAPSPSEEAEALDAEELELAKQTFPNYSPGRPLVVTRGRPLPGSIHKISRAAADMLGNWARTFPAAQDQAIMPLYSGLNADALCLLSRQIVSPLENTLTSFKGFQSEVQRFIFKSVDGTWQSLEANSHELAFLLRTTVHRDHTTVEVGKLRTWEDLGPNLVKADELFRKVMAGETLERTYRLATRTNARRYHLLPIDFGMSLYISIPPAEKCFRLGMNGVNPRLLLPEDPLRILDEFSQTLDGVWFQCFCDFPNGPNGQPLPVELLNEVADPEALAAAYAVNGDRPVGATHTRFVYNWYMPCEPDWLPFFEELTRFEAVRYRILVPSR